jgi:hypothetical protein
MLQHVLRAMQDEILVRFRKRAYVWSAPPGVQAELTGQVQLFVTQIEQLLGIEEGTDATPCCDQIASAGAKHAQSLLRHGFPLAQAVNDYGDVCRVISEVASEQKQPLSEPELQKLSMGSVVAIMAAAREYQPPGARSADQAS